ncbi:hexosaminidase D-like isoform X2 [Daphnia carinata]|nr:hexosaminidase D-like isoform X2 [Daphnia carinata]
MEDGDMETEQTSSYEPLFKSKIVHIDLKGSPPKPTYFADLFPLLAKLGATGILIEYEDMFPYTGTSLENTPARNAYTPSMVLKINQLAKENHLEVIPLIQTFGHLEFLLKLPEHMHLREVPEQPQAICPTHKETLPLLFHMLQQVAKLHPESKRIHIGADEVYFIGRCTACQDRMNNRLWSTSDLFIDHVTAVAKFVNDKLGMRPMMWDDEFRSFTEPQLVQSGIGSLVDLVVWNYKPALELDRDIWAKYLKVFDAIWAASAFKGATGSNQQITSVRYHVENHRAWLRLIEEYRDTPYLRKFKGIMLTGWSRYDHFAVTCELLPAAFPSLAVDLLLLQYGENHVHLADQEAVQYLGCTGSFIFQQAQDTYYPSCNFPGWEVYSVIQNYGQTMEQYAKVLNDSVVRGWLTDYNLAKQFSSPTHLSGIGTELSYLQNSFDALKRESEIAFPAVYDTNTTKEWFESHVKPMADKVGELLMAIEVLRSKNVWPRRPI